MPSGDSSSWVRRGLMPEDYDRWLDPGMAIDDLRAMLKPYDPALMKSLEVSRAVNSVKKDTRECIEPVVR
jgi:putative SOS response-associated peptidase YedK